MMCNQRFANETEHHDVRTDQIRSVREAQSQPISAIDAGLGEHQAGEKRLVSCGQLAAFRTAYGWIDPRGGGAALDPECAAILGVKEGDTITHVARW